MNVLYTNCYTGGMARDGLLTRIEAGRYRAV
jgi:hypothetical protein